MNDRIKLTFTVLNITDEQISKLGVDIKNLIVEAGFEVEEWFDHNDNEEYL